MPSVNTHTETQNHVRLCYSTLCHILSWVSACNYKNWHKKRKIEENKEDKNKILIEAKEFEQSKREE